MEKEERKRFLSRTPGTPAHRQKKQRTHTSSEGERQKQRSRRVGLPEPIDLYSYVVADRSSPNPPRGKSKEGHFRFQNGDNIGSRYKILSLMGEGTFGRVLECWDRKKKLTVAVKVIRSVPKYREAAMIELEVLNTITSNDPDGSRCCIHLQHWFEYHGHVCIVFERLGASLYDFMRRNGYRPFPLDVVQHFARQLLRAVDYLHSLNIVHTDLKPENILLVNSTDYTKLERERCGQLGCRVPQSADIRVIDFGSATFDEDRHSTVVSTRHYRAPEVILGLGWSFQCDLWSAGCILVELITGRALFQTHENLEHLAMIERVVAPIPGDMVKCATKDAQKYFTGPRGGLAWADTATRRSVKNVQQLAALKRLLRTEADASVLPHLEPLHALLANMLSLWPDRRFSARRCLEQDFFRENIRSLLPKVERPRPASEGAGATPARAAEAGAPAAQVDVAPAGRSDAASEARRSVSREPAEAAQLRTAPDDGARAARSAEPERDAAAVTDATAAAVATADVAELAATAPETAAAVAADLADAGAQRAMGAEQGTSQQQQQQQQHSGELPAAAPPTQPAAGGAATAKPAPPRRSGGSAAPPAAPPVATRSSARVASRNLRNRSEAARSEASTGDELGPAAKAPVVVSLNCAHAVGAKGLEGDAVVEDEAPPSDFAEDLAWNHACHAHA